jgi:hypothetical protein
MLGAFAAFLAGCVGIFWLRRRSSRKKGVAGAR